MSEMMIHALLIFLGLGAGFAGLAYGYFVLGARDARARAGSRFYSNGTFPPGMRYMRVGGSSNPDDDGVYCVVDLEAGRLVAVIAQRERQTTPTSA